MQKFDIIDQLIKWKQQIQQDRQDIIAQTKKQVMTEVQKILVDAKIHVEGAPSKEEHIDNQKMKYFFEEQIKSHQQSLKKLAHETHVQIQQLQNAILDKSLNEVHKQLSKWTEKNESFKYEAIKTIKAIKSKQNYEDRLTEYVPDALLQQISQFTSKINENIIDPASKYIGNFQIQENRIRCAGDGKDYQLLSLVPISQKNGSTLTIVNSEGSYIGFGVVDRKYIDDRTSFGRQECIYYFIGNNGVIEGGKWKVYDAPNKTTAKNLKIKMIVEGEEISWESNGAIRRKYKSAQLTDPNINWVPFLIMVKPGDEVIWE